MHPWAISKWLVNYIALTLDTGRIQLTTWYHCEPLCISFSAWGFFLSLMVFT